MGKLNKIYTKKSFKRYDFGGNVLNPNTGTDKKYNDENAGTYDPNEGSGQAQSIGTSTVGAINPLFGTAAKLGTSASTHARGRGNNAVNNTAANFASPFSQFEDNRNAGEWVGSFLNPVGANIYKGRRTANEFKANEQAVINKQNEISNNLAIQRGKQTPVSGNQVYSLNERKEGGKLSKLSNNTVLASGATHENGGIKIPSMQVEVEDKETMKKLKDGGTYVMSDTLRNPTTGNTFAKDDTRLSKLKGRIEKSNNSRFKNAALSLIKGREQNLLDLHEQVRGEEGLETANNTQVARKGGRINPASVTGNDMYMKAGDGLQNATPYIDNITSTIANYQRSQEKVPNLRLLTALNPNHVNYGQAMKDTRDTIRSYGKAVDSTNANQGNANIMKAMALEAQQKGLARISQEEANQNVGIDNEFARRNKEIEKYNNEQQFANITRQQLARDDIRRENQQNVVSAVSKHGEQSKDKKYMKYQQDQLDMDYAGLDDRGVKAFEKRQALRKGKNGGKLSKMYC